LIFVGFQLTFAVITVALISGAIADRVKFSTWLVFSGLWVTLAYFPIAHMVWGGGLLSGRVRPGH
jgi:Amt family ammonium transporter